MLRVLTVCTGNTCRSPIAQAILQARLEDAGLEASVRSAGTLGWSGRPATEHAVTVMEEMGLDLRTHRSRKLEPADLAADLVLAMTRVHAGAVMAHDPAARARVFLPAELRRLLRETSDPDRRDTIISRIEQVGAARTGPTIGRPAEEVTDPAGEPIDVYRATAERLDAALAGLVDVLTA